MASRKLKVVSALRVDEKSQIVIEFSRPLNALEFTGLVRSIEQQLGQS